MAEARDRGLSTVDLPSALPEQHDITLRCLRKELDFVKSCSAPGWRLETEPLSNSPLNDGWQSVESLVSVLEAERAAMSRLADRAALTADQSRSALNNRLGKVSTPDIPTTQQVLLSRPRGVELVTALHRSNPAVCRR